MPYTWIEPEEVLNHNDVTIYRTYKDGLVGSTSEYWYTVDPADDDWEGESAFDVRELKAYDPKLSHEEVLRAAIESGEIEAAE